MKFNVVLGYLFLLTLFPSLRAQETGLEHALLNPQKIESKSFYFLSLIEHIPLFHQSVSENKKLSAIAHKKYEALARTSENDVLSFMNTLQFSEDEVAEIGDILEKNHSENPPLRQLYAKYLLPSGSYNQLVTHIPEQKIIRRMWEQDALAVNRIIDIYGKGEKPIYPTIDSISFDVNAKAYRYIVHLLKNLLLYPPTASNDFYRIPFNAAIALLDINDRDESVVFEPLAEGENIQAYQKAHAINWNKYLYSVLLVLGAGPETPDFPLSPIGKIRLCTAAQKFKERVAPFIMVSGGKVHPYKTQNVEAFYMKKYLMEQFSIPENCIIIKPHARHTTSNVRNAARIIHCTAITKDKPMLVTSFEEHIDDVASKRFNDRCLKELKYVPYRLGKRIGKDFVELYPLENALQINPMEPLDP